MNQLNFPILSLITFFPLFGILLILILGKLANQSTKLLWRTGLVISIAEFVLSLPVLINFASGTAGMQFVEHTAWIESLGISYHLGVDGISLWLVMLTTFMLPLCILCSFTYIQSRVTEYIVSFLLMETAMIGTFLALDMVLFFVFWELMLIPMFLLIGIWGGPRRIYSAVKFFLYTAVGSIFMLVAIITLYLLQLKSTGAASTNLFDLYQLTIPVSAQFWLCTAFFISSNQGSCNSKLIAYFFLGKPLLFTQVFYVLTEVVHNLIFYKQI